MNEKQYAEFSSIVKQCDSGRFKSINVASQVRSDAILAAWAELKEAQKLGKRQIGPHEIIKECPTWYDHCRCTVETLEHNIDRAEKAESELREAQGALHKEQREYLAFQRRLYAIIDDLHTWTWNTDDGQALMAEIRGALAACGGEDA